nr:MAG TPA: hypothetical protein [Caudoviricetes sp.]
MLTILFFKWLLIRFNCIFKFIGDWINHLMFSHV